MNNTTERQTLEASEIRAAADGLGGREKMGFWKLKGAARRYFKWKYGRLAPRIYYDRRYRAYVAPTVMDEFGGIGGIETVCHALASWNLCYGFEIHGEHTHTHSFDEVLRSAYNQAESFSIPKEYEPEYSAQELEWISRLVRQGKRDRALK